MPIWQFKNLDEAKELVSQEPIGSPSVDFKPVELGLSPNQSFEGAGSKLSINPHGKFTIAILNDPTDKDEDGIIQAEDTKIGSDALPPQLRFDSRAWLKLRAEAGVKARGVADKIAKIIAIEGGAEFSLAFADYRVHARNQKTRDAFIADIKEEARFVTNLTDLEKMQPGEALMLRRSGTITAGVTLAVSDIFAGQIGTLGSALGATGPIALQFKAGASVTAKVQVSDDFVIAVSRISADTWRAGFRKARSRRVAPSVDAGISVGFEDEDAVEKLFKGVVDSVLGAPLANVKALVKKASLDNLNPVERQLALAAAERLGLKPLTGLLDDLKKRLDDLEENAANTVKDLAKARIGLSFAYQYSRVEDSVNLLQVTLSHASLAKLHADLLLGRTSTFAQDILAGQKGITLETYLNQRSITSERSWGFSLSLGKWATLGGKDYKKVRRVQKLDLDERRVQESYLGVRGYKGSWGANSMEWAVDLKADMKDYSAEPKVHDYSFGLHLSWLATQKKLSKTELEEWLDTALIWRVFDEASLAEIRDRVATALGRKTQLAVHLTVPNTVFRSVLPKLARMPAEDFAGALAIAMPWLPQSSARTNVARRRKVYEPLWRLAIADPHLSPDQLGQLVTQRLRSEGHDELVNQETAFLRSPDPFSFAGLVRINGNVRETCTRFLLGAGILQTAIDNGARNQGTIDKAMDRMDDLWAQSHHVRAMGAQLVDLAAQAEQLRDVSRAMTIRATGDDDVVITA